LLGLKVPHIGQGECSREDPAATDFLAATAMLELHYTHWDGRTEVYRDGEKA